jgi:hypothetical protein
MAESGTVGVFQAPLLEIVQDRAFKGSTYRMLLILLAEVQPANYIDWSARGLSRRYNMGYQAALNAFKLLQQRDWLRPVYNEWGRLTRYRLSPYLCWRGRPWKARVAQKNWDAEAALTALARTLGEQGPAK